MHHAVLRTVRRHALFAAGARVAVAVSGGADSVALLHLLRELAREGAVVVAGVAHFNHQLRGADADGDETFCRELAASLDVPFDAGRGDVREAAKTAGWSIEDAARRLRYDFLKGAAARRGASAVAIAHTLDDQAETFLLRLVRGAGSRGLAGIRPKAGIFVRPLIEVRRAELREWAAAKNLRFREDATNADVTIPRNRVRHELIPFLERNFSPGIVEVLAREADSAREDEDKLQGDAIESARSVVLVNSSPENAPNAATVRLKADALGSLHPAIAARVVRAALEGRGTARFIGRDDIRRLMEFAATASPGAKVSLPGQQARMSVAGERTIELGPEPPRPDKTGAEAEGDLFAFPLSIPGEVILQPQRMAVTAEWGAAPSALTGSSEWLVRGATLPLVVRSRRPGDRFRPPGMQGRSKKLQDYLVDRKVPRSERDALPLVVDGDGRIVWVAGHGVGEDFRVTGPVSGVILLKARRLGGEV